MSRTTIRWHGKRLEREVRKMMADRLDAIGEMMIERMRENINTPGPPHSTPGDFPHQITGDLSEKLVYKVDRRSLSVKISCLSDHFLAIELGTEDMAARPFMRRTMLEFKPDAKRILTKGVATTGQYKFAE